MRKIVTAGALVVIAGAFVYAWWYDAHPRATAHRISTSDAARGSGSAPGVILARVVAGDSTYDGAAVGNAAAVVCANIAADRMRITGPLARDCASAPLPELPHATGFALLRHLELDEADLLTYSPLPSPGTTATLDIRDHFATAD